MTSATNPLVGCRLLIVEDDYFIAKTMCAEFEAFGAKVIGPVAGVEEALQLVAASAGLDAAVLDIKLQDGMSYRVAEALQARGIPFVFATGYENTTLPERFAHVSHFEKPVEAMQLARALLA